MEALRDYGAKQYRIAKNPSKYAGTRPASPPRRSESRRRKAAGEALMTRHTRFGIAFIVALFFGWSTGEKPVRAIGLQTGNSFATAAAQASPELVSSLSKEMGST